MTKGKDNLRDLFTLRDFVLEKYLTRSREEEGKTTKFFYSSLLSLRTGVLSFTVIARFIRAIYGSHAFAGAKRVMTRGGRGAMRVMTREGRGAMTFFLLPSPRTAEGRSGVYAGNLSCRHKCRIKSGMTRGEGVQ